MNPRNTKSRQLQPQSTTSGPGEVSTTTRVGRDIADCQLPNADCLCRQKPIGNRKSTMGNEETHPLPRGGTDLIGTASIAIQMGKVHQYYSPRSRTQPVAS